MKYRAYPKYDPFYISTKKLLFATRMILNATPAEQALWKKLKSRQLGVTFVQQKVVLGFIPDFFCQKYRIAIEVDGSYHDKEKDDRRTKILNQDGICVLRFTNEQVLQDIDSVISKIQWKIKDCEKRYFAYQMSKKAKFRKNRPSKLKTYSEPRLG